jgi:hypothetical protein
MQEFKILVPVNTTHVITTYNNSDVYESCESRKSTAIAQCTKGKLVVHGNLNKDLSCISSSRPSNLDASCNHPTAGKIDSGVSKFYITYSQSSVTSPSVCESVKKVLRIACNNGNITTSGEVASFENCIQSQPKNMDCFDSSSQRSIPNGSSIKVTSYNGPEYYQRGLCDNNKLSYEAVCLNGVVVRNGKIAQFLTCKEITSERVGKGQFTFVPYGPPSIPCRGTFQIAIQNKSNKQMYLDQGSLAFIGFKTQINYIKDIKIIDSGCFGSQGISPNAGCGITIQNNIPMAKNYAATPLVSIKARYGSEQNFELIDSGIYDGSPYSPYITFIGCN